jgi:hypothetical protein
MTKEKTMTKKQTEKKTTPKKTREAKTRAPTAAAVAKKPVQAEATKPTQAKRKTPPAPEATAAARKSAPIVPVAPRTPDPRLPAPGTVLQKRDRHGAVRCECTVEEGGIRYAGKVYRSLSSAAMAAAKDLGLNNKTQNGFTFWGISKPPRRSGDPLEALERAWERYHGNVAALVKEGVTDENRGKVVSTIRKHAQVIESLRERVA